MHFSYFVHFFFFHMIKDHFYFSSSKLIGSWFFPVELGDIFFIKKETHVLGIFVPSVKLITHFPRLIFFFSLLCYSLPTKKILEFGKVIEYISF